ncbi:L-seryl-tRNA(Sec) kinase [Denticeps clupeoides]|uniref:L-seryl-tRNA(Sec) kinase n=1 Tax=Denticeps clupeoides TaxID=299321 RepID=A0AAY4A8W2_9TELE|nr:L-seryl-tRNA(Sec) kinase [Denticeps clupeoides]
MSRPQHACVCVLCGLPAAGKSTVANALCAHALRRRWGAFTVTYDDLIPNQAFDVGSVGKEQQRPPTQTRWKNYRQAVLSCLEQFLLDPQRTPDSGPCVQEVRPRFCQAVQEQQAQMGLQTASSEPQAPLLILLDDNFYYQSMRYEVHQLARKHSLGFCQVYLDCPAQLCLSRNQSREQPLPNEVIMEMTKRLEPPDPERNPWERRSLILSSSEDLTEHGMQKLAELVSSAFDHPLSPVEDDSEQREADRQNCANSVLHQADQASRRLVSEAMCAGRVHGLSSESLRLLAKDLNESKTGFLQDLRKNLLQGLPIIPGEPIDMERVVGRAVACFDHNKQKILAKHCKNNTTQ